MSDSLIQFPAMASGASFAGTCLMHTMMFTDFFPCRAWRLHLTEGLSESCDGEHTGNQLLDSPPLEDQRRVGAAESKGIRELVLYFRLARHIGNVIQVALGVRLLEIDGRRQNLILQRQDADSCFQAAGSAEQMSRHGLRRAHRDV